MDLQEKQGQINPSNLVTQVLSNDSVLRYSRQLILPQVTPYGQQKLERSSVLIVGAGGLGCPAALYLAAAGVGCIGILDGDKVELSNLHRQVLHSTSTIGEWKAISAIKRLSELNPRVQYRAFTERLTNKNALGIIEQFDVVVDATDNPPTRYIVNDACVITGRPIVCASALRFDGQMTVYNADAGSPCYRCIFPEPPKPEAVGRCAEQGVVGAVCGIMGALQALDTIKLLLSRPDSREGKESVSEYSELSLLNGRLVVLDGLRGEVRVVKLRGRRADCAACSADASKRTVTRESFPTLNYVAFCNGVPLCDAPQFVPLRLVDAADRLTPSRYIKEFVLNPRQHLLLDVRPRLDCDIFRLKNAVSFPLADFADANAIDRLKSIITDAAERAVVNDNAACQRKLEMPIVAVCRQGNTSQRAILKLRELLHNESSTFDRLPVRIALMDIAGGYSELSKMKASEIASDAAEDDTYLNIPYF